MARPWENGSGCPDPTAYKGEQAIEREEQRAADLIKHIRYVARVAGFDIINRVEFDKPYIVRMRMMFSDTVDFFGNKAARITMEIREVPQESVFCHREYKLVEVDALEIEAINCKNCGGVIQVGRLDLHGDTLVRCSFCGSYHTIRKRCSV